MGALVGDLVGDSVGDFVGDSVGDFVGEAVGDVVGLAVGSKDAPPQQLVTILPDGVTPSSRVSPRSYHVSGSQQGLPPLVCLT